MKAQTKRILIAVAILVALTAAALYAYSRTRPRGLVLSGTIEAHSVEVGSLLGGRVREVLVDEGDRVAPGQTVAILETDAVDRQITEQEAAVAASRAQLQKALEGPRKEEIERAAALYENAERERRRYAAMYENGVIPRQQYDDAATRARTAAKDLEILRQGTRREDIEAARAQLQRDLGRLELLKENRSESRVTSGIQGVVQSVAVRPGDIVAANQPVAEILEDGELWVRVYVPEPVLGKVRLGGAATIEVDTFPGREFSGTVSQISQQAEYTPRNIQTRSQRAEVVFGVKVDVAPQEALKPGMAAEVRISGVEASE